MPKLKNRLPKYCKDKIQAVVYINGEKIPLGRYGSDESKKEYSRILAELANIGSVIDHKQKSLSCSVARLTTEFLVWAKEHKGKSDYGNFFKAVQMMMRDYSHTLVKDFGPRALKTVQGQFVKYRWKTKKGIEKRYSRNYCNKLTRFIRHIFKWGVERELVPYEIYEALKSVTPVSKREAKNRPPRTDVSEHNVERALPYFIPLLADMVCVQLFAVMRPSEVCVMRVCDIDRSKSVWVYRPYQFKTDWHDGHTRVIILGKPEQEILERRMKDKAPTDFIFTPADAMREKWELAAASRKSKITPSQQARKEKRAKNPKTKFRPCYTSESYGKAITKAIAVANKHLPVDERLVHFTAYQLRHSGVTKLIEKYGIDVARAIAGHRSAGVTMGYNHADEKIATRIAEERRNPFKE